MMIQNYEIPFCYRVMIKKKIKTEMGELTKFDKNMIIRL